MQTTSKKNKEDFGSHPSQSRSRRFPQDQRLRLAGFKIHSRPKGKPAIWSKEGDYYTETEALAVIGRTRRDDCDAPSR